MLLLGTVKIWLHKDRTHSSRFKIGKNLKSTSTFQLNLQHQLSRIKESRFVKQPKRNTKSSKQCTMTFLKNIRRLQPRRLMARTRQEQVHLRVCPLRRTYWMVARRHSNLWTGKLYNSPIYKPALSSNRIKSIIELSDTWTTSNNYREKIPMPSETLVDLPSPTKTS